MGRGRGQLRHGGEAKSVAVARLSSALAQHRVAGRLWEWVTGGPDWVLGLGAEAGWLRASRQAQPPWSRSCGAEACLAPRPPSGMKSTPVSTSKLPEKEQCDVEAGAEDGAGIPHCPTHCPKLCLEVAVRLSSKPRAP